MLSTFPGHPLGLEAVVNAAHRHGGLRILPIGWINGRDVGSLVDGAAILAANAKMLADVIFRAAAINVSSTDGSIVTVWRCARNTDQNAETAHEERPHFSELIRGDVVHRDLNLGAGDGGSRIAAGELAGSRDRCVCLIARVEPERQLISE